MALALGYGGDGSRETHSRPFAPVLIENESKGVTDVRYRPPEKSLLRLKARPAADPISTRAARALNAALAIRPHSCDASAPTLIHQRLLPPVEPLVTAALRPVRLGLSLSFMERFTYAAEQER
jgi:hypothetical protein